MCWSQRTNCVIHVSRSFLAIRNLSGIYYLNGYWRIDHPKTLRFAGTLFHYDADKKGFHAAESITALGPITEALYIVVSVI